MPATIFSSRVNDGICGAAGEPLVETIFLGSP